MRKFIKVAIYFHSCHIKGTKASTLDATKTKSLVLY